MFGHDEGKVEVDTGISEDELINAFKDFWKQPLEKFAKKFLDSKTDQTCSLRERLNYLTRDDKSYVMAISHDIEKRGEDASARELHFLGLLYSKTFLRERLHRINQDLPKRLFKQAQDKGDVSAFASLGAELFYAVSCSEAKEAADIDKNSEHVLSLYLKSAEHNDSFALQCISYLKGYMKQEKESVSYALRAFRADGNNTDAIISLSSSQKDLSDQQYYVMEAIKKGSIRGVLIFALAFRDGGMGLEQDLDSAVTFFRLCADLQLLFACLELGKILMHSNDSADQAESIAYLEAASEGGHFSATIDLLDLNIRGRYHLTEIQKTKIIDSIEKRADAHSYAKCALLFSGQTVRGFTYPRNETLEFNYVLNAYKKNKSRNLADIDRTEILDEYLRTFIQSEDPNIIFQLRFILQGNTAILEEKFNRLAIEKCEDFYNLVGDISAVKPLLSAEAFNVFYLYITEIQLRSEVLMQLTQEANFPVVIQQLVASYIEGDKLSTAGILSMLEEKSVSSQVPCNVITLNLPVPKPAIESDEVPSVSPAITGCEALDEPSKPMSSYR